METIHQLNTRLWRCLGAGLLAVLLLAAFSGRAAAQDDEDAPPPLALRNEFRMQGRIREHLRRTVESRPEDPRPLLALAQFHHRSGELDQARQKYLEAINLDEEQTLGAAREGLAEVLTAQGFKEEAQRRWEEAVQLMPGRVEPWVGLARYHRLREDPVRARETLDVALTLDPQHVPALMELGSLEAGQGNTQTAQDAWQRVLKADADHAGAHYNLGIIALREDDLERAARHAAAAVDAAPRAAQPAYLSGLVLLRQGRTEPAVFHFRRATERAPGWPLPWRQLAAHYEQADAPKARREVLRTLAGLGAATRVEAQELLQHARETGDEETQLVALAALVGKDATDIEMTFTLAQLYEQRGQGIPARALYQQVLREDPAHPGAAMEVSVYLIGTGRLDRARKILNRAVEAHPDHVELRLTAARAAIRAQEMEEALAHLQHARELAPQNVEVLDLVSQILVRQGKPEEALAVLEEALPLDPGPEVRLHLAEIYLTARQPDRAAALLEQLLDERPKDPDTLYAAGWAQARTEDWERALALWERGARVRPNEVRFWKALAEAYPRAGQPARALGYLTRIVSEEPTNVTALRKLARLRERLGQFARAHAVWLEIYRLRPEDEEASSKLRELRRKLTEDSR